MTTANGGDDHFMTREEDALQKLLKRAFVHTWKKLSEGSRTPVFTDRYAFYQFYEAMSRMGDSGFELGAAVFMRVGVGIERPVRSIAITKLALSLSWNSGFSQPPRESAVAALGGFVGRIAAALPSMILEWAEDMNSDDPSNGLESQPTDVIRGVLMSPSFKHAGASRFWVLAAASDKFPCRIFFDRCRHDEGALFSPYHLRAFGTFLDVAPPEAVRHFGSHLRNAVLSARIERRDEDGRKVFVPFSDVQAVNLLESIAGYVDNSKRQKEVREIFAERPAKPEPKADPAAATDPPAKPGEQAPTCSLPSELHPL